MAYCRLFPGFHIRLCNFWESEFFFFALPPIVISSSSLKTGKQLFCAEKKKSREHFVLKFRETFFKTHFIFGCGHASRGCARRLTSAADVCRRMPTYADVC